MSDQEQKALEFVSKVSKTTVKNADDLKSGVVLCNVINEIAFRLIGTRPITAISKFGVAFAQMENLSKAIDAMRRDLKVLDRDIFTTANLYEKDNLPQVWHCLLVLQKQYDAAAPRAGEFGSIVAAAPPNRPAPSAPAAPNRQAPPTPRAAVNVVPPTPRTSTVAPLTPKVDEEKKISSALEQLDTQRQRWNKEREEMEAKIAAKDKLLAESKQREDETNKLLNDKGNIEYQLQQQYAKQLSEMQADLTNKLAQKTLEIEKMRSARDVELQNAQLSSNKQVEQLTLKLAEYEQLKQNNASNQANDQKQMEEKYKAEMDKIREQLGKEKEQALLQHTLQLDRDRMESEQRAIETIRAQSEQQIQRLKEQAEADLQREVQKLREQHEEELVARGAGRQNDAARLRSGSLAASVEQEIAQRQFQIEEELRQQFDKDLATVKQGIELRMKSEEAAFKEKEQKLQQELNSTSKKLEEEKKQYEAQLAALQQNQSATTANASEIDALKAQLRSTQTELEKNAALQKERDQFKAQQEEISKAKATMETQYQTDLSSLEKRLQDETNKLQELQALLELKTKENEALQAQKKDNTQDEAELKQIKADMEKEMQRLTGQMVQTEEKLKAEKNEADKKNAQIQNQLEQLQQQLEAEKQSKATLQKQVQQSEQQIKALESASTAAPAASASPSDREQVLEAEITSLKEKHQREVDSLNREIESLKKQLAAAKAAGASSPEAPSAAPANRPVNPMMAALKANTTPVEATAGEGVTSRPPNPMAMAFKQGGGASVALNSTPAADGDAPPARPAMGGLLAGIQGGGLKLKKTTPGQGVGPKTGPGSGPAPKPAGPLSLVDQLKGGIQLKKAEPRAPPPKAEATPMDLGSAAQQLARERQARLQAGQAKMTELPPKK